MFMYMFFQCFALLTVKRITFLFTLMILNLIRVRLIITLQ
uniref:Uncharacterized protein n=1 Tax=Mus musculus TaxID=10090 RepID=Q3UUL2_MOUSE|nr:unnamed protein product [Mus musculus]